MDPMTISLILSGLGLGGQALSSLFGRKETQGQYGQQSSATPGQSNLLGQATGGMPMQQMLEAIKGQLGGQSPQDDILKRQFSEDFIPQLSEQFSGMGALGSSGFQQQATQGAQRLTENLAGQRAQTQQQGIANASNLFGQSMGARTTFPTYTPGQPSTAQNLAPTFGQITGAGLGMLENNYLMNLL